MRGLETCRCQMQTFDRTLQANRKVPGSFGGGDAGIVSPDQQSYGMMNAAAEQASNVDLMILTDVKLVAVRASSSVRSRSGPIFCSSQCAAVVLVVVYLRYS